MIKYDVNAFTRLRVYAKTDARVKDIVQDFYEHGFSDKSFEDVPNSVDFEYNCINLSTEDMLMPILCALSKQYPDAIFYGIDCGSSYSIQIVSANGIARYVSPIVPLTSDHIVWENRETMHLFGDTYDSVEEE